MEAAAGGGEEESGADRPGMTDCPRLVIGRRNLEW